MTSEDDLDREVRSALVRLIIARRWQMQRRRRVAAAWWWARVPRVNRGKGSGTHL